MEDMAEVGRLIIGAMSGTSADGVDVALVRVQGRGLESRAELLAYHDRAFDPRFAARVQAVRSRGETGLRELAEIGRVLSLVYAIAVNELLVATATSPAQIACIAAHGQTLFHAPPLTIQWLDPALLAARTGCCVVSDFRRADCALGGQGAPLVPYGDYLLFRHEKESRLLVNIGGIANVTWLPAGGGIGDVLAYDTGPGNCLSDRLMQTRGGGRFDAGGDLAMTGKPLEPLVQAVLGDAYFKSAPPKSTDGPAMVRIFERETLHLGLQDAPLADLLASACEITARCIVAAAACVKASPDVRWVLAGGGVRNKTLRQAIARHVGASPTTTDEFNIPSQAREAAVFALLGAARLDEVPASLPRVTGAGRAAVLGTVCLP